MNKLATYLQRSLARRMKYAPRTFDSDINKSCQKRLFARGEVLLAMSAIAPHASLTADVGFVFALNYAPKVVSGVEIDGTKWQKCRYYAPIIRACRSRKSTQRSQSSLWHDVEAGCPRKRIPFTSGDSVKTLEAAMTVKAERPRQHAMGLPDDRSPLSTANVFAVCGTQTDSRVYTARISTKAPLSFTGSGAFPAVVPDYPHGISRN